MLIKTRSIPEEGMEVYAETGPNGDAWFENLLREAFEKDFQKGHAASLRIHLDKTCDNISVSGSATVDLSPECGRCLETFEKNLELPLRVHLSPSKAVEIEDSEDENFAFYKGEEINLGNILREILMLEIPLRYLCSENCKGLCARCGQNLNLKSCACLQTQSSPPFTVLGKLIKN